MQGKDPEVRGEISDNEGSQTSTKTEIKTLKAELERVKTQMSELQRDYSDLQQDYGRLNSKQRKSWALGWKRIKNYALFHSKVDGDEIGGQQRSHLSRRFSLRRRLSMS